jgi:hypothetical protein
LPLFGETHYPTVGVVQKGQALHPELGFPMMTQEIKRFGRDDPGEEDKATPATEQILHGGGHGSGTMTGKRIEEASCRRSVRSERSCSFS